MSNFHIWFAEKYNQIFDDWDEDAWLLKPVNNHERWTRAITVLAIIAVLIMALTQFGIL